MMFSDLEKITDGKVLRTFQDLDVHHLVIDSRKALVSKSAVFFALVGARNDGHKYIKDLYDAGFRQFVIEKTIDLHEVSEANVLLVKSTRHALQDIVSVHRAQFKYPVIGITGSNGKTIVKEWLYQLLSPEYKIVKNPASYNSQVGVPLSVWAMQSFHQLAIFEAGISKLDEMDRLEKIIQPTIGIFTNIGTAHDEGFDDQKQKVKEKLKLFRRAKVLIYCSDHVEIDAAIQQEKIPALSWGENGNIKIDRELKSVRVTYQAKRFKLELPFTDRASVENVCHCLAIMLLLDYSPEIIQQRISEIRSVPMRLELKEGINNTQVVDDTYNNDMGGLQISLDFLAGQQKKTKTVVLSDVLQSGMSSEEIADSVVSMLKKVGVSKFIGIGSSLKSQQKKFVGFVSFFFSTTEDFIRNFDFTSFEGETILVKGARVFQFEKIVQKLQRKAHGTVMQIDLGKMVHNLNFFKSKLRPNVKIMAMVKAFAYGSGSEEVANLLQYHRVDYLGVAYADEGVELRNKNIALPIMVMNPTEESFDLILANHLEPAIYSLKMLKALEKFLEGRELRIHLEVETGMHRLGLNEDELGEVLETLKRSKNIQIASVFSHLAGSDESIHDGYSKEQFEKYQASYRTISSGLDITPLRHILNSAGILRLPEFQMDMVRLGIGLYGVDPTTEKFSELQPVATLKTVISQIKNIAKGESVGYGRKGTAEGEMRIATIAIGYADGFSRSFSGGNGIVLVNGKKAPVIGNVCMDMTMVDVSGIFAHEGDEVIIFGDDLSIHEVAERIDTIPYEILTNTSSRVKRVFVSEGI
ncbi:MAG TPA: bifunctional UDP-N-acetylmuramoyl-tripeptide:D-alanyl-D-alanine ligase/alanine racemase [Cyclobacteriaceae bacterium]|nr:bifunctional UDP-N-acetylmuramoyl-tripeptide:D-alanyl-D-alanine ligase/alanine racemase [Cyclobacteriaceae bacterium]